MALDSSSTPTVVSELIGGTPWATNGTETGNTAEAIKAAPGAGFSLYIEEFIITSNDADAYPHLQDEDDTVLIGPFYTSANGVVISHVLKNPIKLTANKALEIKLAAAGNVSFYVAGRTKRDPA